MSINRIIFEYKNKQENFEKDIKKIFSNCPKQYPKNNWLRFHGKNTIPRSLRNNRKKEILTYFNKKKPDIYNLLEKYIVYMVDFKENDFKYFVDIKDLNLGNKNIYEKNKYM